MKHELEISSIREERRRTRSKGLRSKHKVTGRRIFGQEMKDTKKEEKKENRNITDKDLKQRYKEVRKAKMALEKEEMERR